MNDYNSFDFTINSDEELLEIIHEAADFGYPPMVLINGMYYELPYLKEKESD